MKKVVKIPVFLLFMLPLTAIGQVNPTNPPVQQLVNLYGGNEIMGNPTSNDNKDNFKNNNEFVIHEEIQSNKVGENFSQQSSSNHDKGNIQGLSYGGGGSSLSGSVKIGLNLKRSKVKIDKKFHRFFHRNPKKKRSNTSCFSWS